MKTFLTTAFAIFLFTVTCSAQNTFPATGSVGIGTTTPVNLLHVVGSGATALTIERNTTLSNISAEFKNGTASWFAGQAGTNGNFGIATSNNLQSSTLFNITTAGNVGIGTNVPANKLHIIDVTGTNTLNLQLSTNTLGETIGVAFGTQPGNRTKAAITGVNTNSGNAGGALAFYTNAGASLNEVMRISSAGNVGIGNAAPGTSLHVGPGGVFSMRDGAGSSFTPELINSQTSGVAGLGVAVVDGTNNPRIGLFADQPNNIVGISTVYSANSPAFVYRGAGTGEVFRITPAGNMGIGTANPDQKLTVKGTIHSSEVIVDTNIPTPDYVFDKTYDLPTLTSVKSYIDKNHHLSEIPSASEVTKNGQRVGEMNMLLLKKVEELTLYLIEKDKQVKALEQQRDMVQQQKETLQEQQAQINQLKKQVDELLNVKNNK